MTKPILSPAELSDQQLLARVKTLAEHERKTTAALIAALAELDARRLYLGEGCSSLFTYCTQILHLSEHAAYGRIEAARAARRFPILLDLLADGALTLTAVGLLAPRLTTDNHAEVLAAARYKSKREVELLVATLRPRAPVPSSVRKLPGRTEPKALALVDAADAAEPVHQLAVGSGDILSAGDSSTLAPRQRPEVAPLAPERYKVQFTATRATYEKLRRAQDLLRHVIPAGDLSAVFDRALTLLLADLEKRKLAATDRPVSTRPSDPASRHIPAAVKREVWARDCGQCAFVGVTGRCAEHGFLEFHHVVPYAVGGASDAENLELRCRAHNAYEAQQYFGPLFGLGPDRVECR